MDDLLPRLEGVQTATGGAVARCPAHPDRNPSLSIREAEDRLLVKCHGGCETPDVMASLGLRMNDLFYDTNGIPGPPPPSDPTAEYVYTDERGGEIERKVRYEGWRSDPWLKPVKRFETKRRRYPYHVLPLANRQTDVVYIVEGEKDVHALEQLGLVATTGGAGNVWEEWWGDYFRGADVVIVQDRDKVNPRTGTRPGEENARRISAALLGYARSIKIVEALIGKDAADHLQLFRPDQFREVMVVKK
jgi:hypothetical protein